MKYLAIKKTQMNLNFTTICVETFVCHITAASSSIHVSHGFLTPVPHTTTVPSSCLLFIIDSKTIGGRRMTLFALSFGMSRVRNHNPWIDSLRRFLLHYCGSAVWFDAAFNG